MTPPTEMMLSDEKPEKRTDRLEYCSRRIVLMGVVSKM